MNYFEFNIYYPTLLAIEAAHPSDARILKASQIVEAEPRLLGSPPFLSRCGAQQLKSSQAPCSEGIGKGIMCGKTDFCPIR